jgi:predicted TIM-barrel fold metal-dependent hydrolase
MLEVPIFDSLTHPTMNGAWLRPEVTGRNTVRRLLEEMEANDVRWALAVGMEGIGNYDATRYAAFIRSQSEKLLPVAYLNLGAITQRRDLIDEVNRISRLGYVGVKIHPRLSGVTYAHPYMVEAIQRSNAAHLLVVLCTYGYEVSARCAENTVDRLIELLSQVPDARLVLAHAGTVRLLELSHATRGLRDVLIDLSFTLCRYAGSSLDLDIKYLFRTLDTGVCIGSDSPEFTLFDLRQRFTALAGELGLEQRANIAYKNLRRLVEMTAP